MSNPLAKTEPKFIQLFCDRLLRHSELKYVEDSELRLVSSSQRDILDKIQSAKMYQDFETWEDKIVLFSTRGMAKQAPKEKFFEAVKKKIEIPGTTGSDDCISLEDIPMLELRRLMEGICVKDSTGLHLLCDDSRSLMQMLYGTQLVILRVFECPC